MVICNIFANVVVPEGQRQMAISCNISVGKRCNIIIGRSTSQDLSRSQIVGQNNKKIQSANRSNHGFNLVDL